MSLHMRNTGCFVHDNESFMVPQEALKELTASNAQCIGRLSAYLRQLKLPDLSPYPRASLAAVLILLYERDGLLRVLLTTRAKHMRTHPGQTALPGGRWEGADVDLVATAANEEIGLDLPDDSPYIFTLGVLEPFLSLHKLVVTPVVALLTNPTVLKRLRASESEVAKIFSHPIEAFLDPSLSAKSETLSALHSGDWPYDADFYVTLCQSTSDCTKEKPASSRRSLRFRTSASPIKGMTADILVYVAEIAYDRKPEYERLVDDSQEALRCLRP